MEFQPGQRIGAYEIVARLGAGGLGAVYEVQDLISRRAEAMKVLPSGQDTSGTVEDYLREVQALAALNHVNIARIHSAFQYENQLAIVMELVHGETLRDLRFRMGVTMRRALDYMDQTLKALAYAHDLGFIHRDIKPSNIMITSGGFVKLLDCGIARSRGSLSYMSPEQISGGAVTTRSDLYSVGVTLYELLTGSLPIAGENDEEITKGHLHHAPAPLHRLAPEVPGVVSDAVMRALAKDPAERFATAEDFLHSLRLTSTSIEAGNTYIGPFPMARMKSPPPTVPGADTPWPVVPAASAGLENLSADEISRKLAAYIGPVAKFVVRKLAAQSVDPHFIYREAAKEIPSEKDRAAFLRSLRQ